jgi:hypothetical protein
MDLQTKDAATRCHTLGGNNGTWYYSDAGKWNSDTQSIEIVCYTIGSNGANFTLGLKHNQGSTTSRNTGYYLMWCANPTVAPTANKWRIVYKNNHFAEWGAAYGTELANYNGASPVSGDTVRLEYYSGGDIKAYHNGTEIMSANNSAISDFGYPMVGNHNGGIVTASDVWWDTVQFDDGFLESGGGGSPFGLGTLDASWNRNLGHP